MARHLTRLRMERISYDMRTVPRGEAGGLLGYAAEKAELVSCPLSGSVSSLNFNLVFSKFSLSGLDFDGVNARLVCCVVPVLLSIQAFTQASALPGADSAVLVDLGGCGLKERYLLIQ